MFRRNSTRTNFTITPPPWSRRPLTGRYLAGLTFGVLGTLYYARHKIYADAPSDAHHDNHQVHSNPRNDHHYRDDSASRHGEVPGRWNDLHFFDKIREHSATGRIKGDSGIARIDATAVPKFVSPYESFVSLIVYISLQLYSSTRCFGINFN